MEGISCSGVHRKRTWLGSASRSPFTGEVLEDAAQSEVTAEDTAQQLLKLPMMSSWDLRITQVERYHQVQTLVKHRVSL